MNISRVSRKVLPLATSAAIGLGALTACSSSNNQKTEPDYYQAEVVRLDNTLDSLKASKNEGVTDFFDYYDKSKTAINNATIFNKEYKDTRKPIIFSGFIALGFLGMGLMSHVVKGLSDTDKKMKKAAQIATIVFTSLSGASLIGGFAAHLKSGNIWQAETKLEKHKETKLEKLDAERNQFINNMKANKKEL